MGLQLTGMHFDPLDGDEARLGACHKFIHKETVYQKVCTCVLMCSLTLCATFSKIY